MTNSSLELSLPTDFILRYAVPTAGELVAGYRLGWLTPQTTVELALAGLGVVPDATAAYEELALLLSDRLYELPALIDDIERSTGRDTSSTRFWLFLALRWVYDHRTDFSDPLGTVEQLYADFDYPEEVEGFVRFLPVADGARMGVDALFGRWLAYLETSEVAYRRRFHRDGA
ncbi:DUF2247 family protein [Actinoplanes sp. TRM 88003]|uniref:DUF2247 family protein n=1 Tax=Paractinoplanes aksuensis TaxID=2939490 RepID=A0ABT1DT40_9ACTN|nr:DUF2247 family protein [Actinoplanes aksuensis]MCO8273673.1 DUF2247 family protein [Actinoplanes aksuensis]